MPSLGDVIATVEGWYDPAWAESWDAVGLVCGDPAAEVRRVVLAVDAVPATLDAAAGAQLLITHHPLLLTPVHGVATSDPKGALVHRMIRSGLAHYVAHSNAEIGPQGVSDALAATLGLHDVGPVEAVTATGAVGVGRVGDLIEPSTLARFAAHVNERLPATVGGVRASGDPQKQVRRVAVLAGSGSSLIGHARRSGADVFVTADLKHHHAVEAVTQRRPVGVPTDADRAMALVEVSHWASEVPWLQLLARRLRQRFGDTVAVTVSDVVTDPWSLQLPSLDRPGPPERTPISAPRSTPAPTPTTTRDEGI